MNPRHLMTSLLWGSRIALGEMTPCSTCWQMLFTRWGQSEIQCWGEWGYCCSLGSTHCAECQSWNMNEWPVYHFARMVKKTNEWLQLLAGAGLAVTSFLPVRPVAIGVVCWKEQHECGGVNFNAKIHQTIGGAIPLVLSNRGSKAAQHRDRQFYSHHTPMQARQKTRSVWLYWTRFARSRKGSMGSP